jgi:hypothetical protein
MTYLSLHKYYRGRDSSVGIATRNGLDGPGIESRWGRDCPHLSRPVLGPIQPPIQWVPGLSRGYSGRGVAMTTTPSSAEVKGRVELYLYSPSGPSWPVLGWTLPLPFTLQQYCATSHILIKRVWFIGCTNLNVAHPPNGNVELVFRVTAPRNNVDCILVFWCLSWSDELITTQHIFFTFLLLYDLTKTRNKKEVPEN